MKICIDAGHGMSNKQAGIYDPGATHVENGFKFEEATLTLRYALALKDVLRARQVECFLTRDDATDHTPVQNRAAMARKAGCTAFVSLHLNDYEDDAANGIEVLYGNKANEALAQRLQSALVQCTGMRDRKIKLRTDLAVLKFDGPAVLVELGFIGNDADRGKLLDAQLREAICACIAGVMETAALPA